MEYKGQTPQLCPLYIHLSIVNLQCLVAVSEIRFCKELDQLDEQATDSQL